MHRVSSGPLGASPHRAERKLVSARGPARAERGRSARSWVASGGLSRYPLYDAQGTVRRLADDSGAKTDYYTHSAFGYEYPPTGSTPNPYRFGGAWGYITDTPGSGLLQLGARFYWPEVGRFIQQDPIGEGINWYAYAGNSPVRGIDPEGEDYLDLSVSYGIILGVQIGNDPCATQKPWRWWAASTWRNVHPYVGGIGSPGLSVTYAPDVGGDVQTPCTGWYKGAQAGYWVGGQVGEQHLGGPWYEFGHGDLFWEVGLVTPGLSIGGSYIW